MDRSKRSSPNDVGIPLRAALTDRELALGRSIVVAFALSGAVMLGLLAVFFVPSLSRSLGKFQGTAEGLGAVVVGVAFGVTALAFMRHSWERGKSARLLMENEAMYCPCCAYSLKGVEEIPGACPECGVWIESRAWLVAYWDSLYGPLMRRVER